VQRLKFVSTEGLAFKKTPTYVAFTEQPIHSSDPSFLAEFEPV
jgi:hypothetical protein